MQVDDYLSKKYVDVFDPFDALDISLRYGSDAWTKVFTGLVSTVSPQISKEGETLQAVAWGDGNALVKTFCNESYGVESILNSAVNTPKEILEDFIDEHVNKIFGVAAAANWSIGKSVDDAHAGLSVTSLNSQYLSNFVLVNRICDLVNAYAAGLSPAEASTHWYVDTTPNLMFKKIDADHTGGDWDRYWRGTQLASTIVVKEDMVLYDFKKNSEEYANDIVLSSKWRFPVEDYLTEDNGGQALWGDDGNVTKTNSATSIVGSHSLLLEPNAGIVCAAHYPAAQNLSLNLENAGSSESIPTFGFYVQKNKDVAEGTTFWLVSSAGNYVQPWYKLETLIGASPGGDDQWVYLEFPVGPYRDRVSTELTQLDETGTMDWTDLDYIVFRLSGDNDITLYIDDLHFSGVVVREAKDTSEITTNNTYMRVLRNNTAVDDTLTTGVLGTSDAGTAARLAYAELLRRSRTPVVGMIKIPLVVDILPGQTVHIHACQKADDSYRVDSDMRVKELRHNINALGAATILNLTDDVMNTHAFGAPDAYSLLREYAGVLGQAEAQNLKGGSLDNLVSRLSESY